MNTGATATAGANTKSVLDKPLHELTENDISQLTREDCRRYLKEKGMRRPSWNKSQAIQQVISLKSLLEPTPAKPAIRPPPIQPTTGTIASDSSSSVKEIRPVDKDASLLGLAEGGHANGPEGPSRLDATREGECCDIASDSKANSVRRTDAPHLPIGQMTIFYSGKVNVYDEVPADKARAIMHLGASPIQLFHDEPSGGNSVHLSTPRRLCAPNVKCNVAAKDFTIPQSAVTDAEGHTNRQVLLHRYFEKRKDRGKFKMKRNIGSCGSGLEMYMNHQMRNPAIDGQIPKCTSSSPCQHRIPGIVHGLLDEQPENSGQLVDLNEKA